MTSINKYCNLIPGGEATWTLTLTTANPKLADRVENYIEFIMNQEDIMRKMHVCGNCRYALRAVHLSPCKDCEGYSKWEWDEEV